MIHKFIETNSKESFLIELKKVLIDDYEVNCDEDGVPTESEMIVNENIIAVATEMDFKNVEKDLATFFIKKSSKKEKVQVIFSADLLADEIINMYQ